MVLGDGTGVRAMPKVELHCHLFGTVRQQTFRDLNARAGGPLADEEITSFYTRGEKPVVFVAAWWACTVTTVTTVVIVIAMLRAHGRPPTAARDP